MSPSIPVGNELKISIKLGFLISVASAIAVLSGIFAVQQSNVTAIIHRLDTQQITLEEQQKTIESMQIELSRMAVKLDFLSDERKQGK